MLTFLLVALFDCSGCLIGLSMKAGLIRGVGDDAVPGGVWALIASAIGTMIAAATGCSPSSSPSSAPQGSLMAAAPGSRR